MCRLPFETPLALDPLEYHRAHVQRGVKAGDDGGDASSIDGSVLVHPVDSLQCLLVCNATRRRPRRLEPSRGRVVVNLELLASCSPAIAAAHGGVGGGGGGISIGRSDRDKAVHVEMLAAHVNIKR
jgi:hypothetical protein